MKRCLVGPILACLVGCFAAIADDPSPKSVPLSDLPEPAAEIKDLLQRAGVRITAGNRSEETTATESKKNIAAETTYQISYDYQSRTRWRVTKSGGSRRVTITVDYSAVKLDFDHTLWFRRCPDLDRFWQDKLVLHELDHVTLSSDPRLVARFKEMLAENNVIVEELSSNGVVNSRVINRLVDQRTEQVFSQLNELVAIRYQELDRVTNHGVEPIPAESPLSGLLHGAAPSP